MIEIVFSDSAAGSLKVAAARKFLDEPPEEILSLPLCLQVGSLRGDTFWEERFRTLFTLFSPFSDKKELVEILLENAKQSVKALSEAVRIRIWISESSEDVCGLLWLLASFSLPDVVIVRLPAFEIMADGAVVSRTGFAEVDPEDWNRLAKIQTPLAAPIRMALRFVWQQLVEDDAPLRAIINGRITSVPETFYDFLIERELRALPETFEEPLLIGRVLSRGMGISDGWIAYRTEHLVREGHLEVVSASTNDVAYYRRLRKIRVF